MVCERSENKLASTVLPSSFITLASIVLFISGYFTGAVEHVGLLLAMGDVISTCAHHELMLIQIHACG